jgi:outer membrane biogenesis lipoprotein LolB
MMKNISLASLRLGVLLAMTAFLAACAATTTTTATNNNQTHKYNSQECKQMRGRGVINLDQYKKCVYGQPFETMDKAS